MTEPMATLETVLCIPGLWKERTELVTRIATDSDGYIFAGRIMMHMQTTEGFELQVEAADPRMADAFAAVGRHWVTDEDLELIRKHAVVLYLIGQGGSRSRAEALMKAAGGLLKAGGLAVKVESSGIAHQRDAWLEMVERLYLFSAHRAFIVTVTSGKDVYTCGMHNLGYPDAIVDAAGSEDPVQLVCSFTRYLFFEAPEVNVGETFSDAPGEPIYRLSHEECRLYEEGSLFTNPFGMWRLTRVS